MVRAYDVPATWADHADEVTPAPMPGGHFFIDSHPDETAELLHGWFSEG